MYQVIQYTVKSDDDLIDPQCESPLFQKSHWDSTTFKGLNEFPNSNPGFTEAKATREFTNDCI